MIMKTPFMWSGSKDRDYKVIKNYIPDFETYNEPFLGSGAVYFRLLADRGIFSAFCADVNEELITTFEVIRDNPEELIKKLPLKKNKEIFQQYIIDSPLDKIDQAVRFLYLNRNRFFGMGGWMNADRYAYNSIVERIRYFSPLMQKTIFYNSCFECKIDDGSFFFCDPPYPDTNTKACYSLDIDVTQLNIEFLTTMIKSETNFFWVTKYSEKIFDIANLFNSDVLIEKKEWTYRKPGMSPQISHELYVSRKEKI